MNYQSRNRSDFHWIGESSVSLKNKQNYHYKSFSLNGVVYEIGDCVLIRNEDSVDPEDISNCYVAQIIDLYHTDFEPELYQAKIKWFSRISDLTKQCQSSVDPIYPNELVEDNRRTWSDVLDLETIFNKCLVIYLSDFQELPETICEREFPVFFCRYGLVRNKLKPLNNSITKTKSASSTPVKKVTGHTSSKAEKQYCVVQTGSLKFPKILIKKMDNKILDCNNETVRILIAKPNAKSIEDMTENLSELSLLSPTRTPTRKRPYIHSLNTTPKTRSRDMHLRSSPNVMNCESDSDSQEEDIQTQDIDLSKKDISTPHRASARIQSSLKKDPIKQSPCKKAKISKRLEFSTESNNHSVTRSGRKVKSVTYSEKCSSDEECKTAVMSSKRKMLKFIRTTYSDDSESENAYSNESTSEEEDSESDASSMDAEPSVTKNGKKTPKPSKKTAVKRLSTIPSRKTPLKGPQNVLEESRLRLHVSTVPNSLPCREEEYSDIYSFVKGCLCTKTGGCMYISGLPGTGKTATVHEVIRNLEAEKEDIPLFTFVEVNGMRMTDPYQCYVQIYKSLTGKTIASQQAANLLEKRFTAKDAEKDAVVLLVDELDRLWTRKQTVMYNIFDWPSKKHSKLIVLAIANTMDLPERLMMNRISSRLGLTRKTFSPYNFKQLQEIIMSRIQELQVFDSDAVQLVARKVAAVSGDARRALDICRHAIEVAERVSPQKKRKILVGMEHVDVAIQQMFSSPVISAIRSCSKMEKLFFQGTLNEFNRTGSEETTLLKVSQHIASTCRLEGIPPPPSPAVSTLCARLAHSHLILLDNFQNGLHMKIRLKPSPDDVKFALTEKKF